VMKTWHPHRLLRSHDSSLSVRKASLRTPLVLLPSSSFSSSSSSS
jgi:hypothetical protein